MVSDINLVGTGEQLDGSLNTIISKFMLLTQETPVVKPTATHMTLEAHKGRGVNVNNYDRALAYDLDDGVDITQAQQLGDTTTTYNPNEVGGQVILAGSAMRRSADPSLENRTAQMLANGYVLKEDQDGCSQFSSFTATLGAANTVCSPGHFAAASSLLRIGNTRAAPEPAPKPWNAVIHPNTAMVVRGRILPFTDVPTGTSVYGAAGGAHGGVTLVGALSPLQQRLLLNGPGSLGQLEGLIVREDANITIDGSDDGVNGFYASEGLVFVSEVAPRLDPDRSDKSMRGAVELNYWGSFTWGVYRAGQYGIAGTFDASNPSS